MEVRDALRAEVLELVGRGARAPADEEGFERLALEVFRYQFAEAEPYRRFCERRGRTPDSVARWTEIPAVPTAAFKAAPLVCGDPGDVEVVFRTSGTTQGPENRGAHHVRDLALYEASALVNFQGHVLPDGARLPMLVLGPTLDSAPDSSLTWMLERVRREFGANGSAHFADADGLRLVELQAALAESEAGARPVALLGTAAAFAHLLEAMDERGRRFRLPPGSRIMETGGFKRRGREIPREEFYKMLVDGLGLSAFYCVAEYGMTEMCSQFYDNVLRERARGRSPALRYKVVPPWVRTQVVDPETLEPCAEGRVGLLRHLDLANLDSVAAIQTDDLGVAGVGGFELLGRAAGAELRGCSIAMDQWLNAQR
ncbi:MAG: long-chain fatty acid--CoA ligase [Gemmatimonadota bacterium]|nr:MAG: long-chain fatty acid--CoA ligase [Gemmatimonadota bacterium]